MPRKPSPQALGGQARAKALTATRRSNIARAAAQARWSDPHVLRRQILPRRKLLLLVSMMVPAGATDSEAVGYVRNAVQDWCGQLQPPGWGPGGEDPSEPGDPMFSLNPSTVTVRKA